MNENEVESQKLIGDIEKVDNVTSNKVKFDQITGDVDRNNIFMHDDNCHLSGSFRCTPGMVCKVEASRTSRSPAVTAINKTPVRNLIVNRSVHRNNKTSSTKRSKQAGGKQTQMGIKPFLCLRGKLQKGSLSPKKTLSVKDRVKQFEVEANDVPEDKSSKSLVVENNKNNKSEKIKRMLSLYENGSPLLKKMVREPVKDLKDVEANARNVVKVQNAFEVLMASGDSLTKTPRKSTMKAKKSSAAKKWKVGKL